MIFIIGQIYKENKMSKMNRGCNCCRRETAADRLPMNYFLPEYTHSTLKDDNPNSIRNTFKRLGTLCHKMGIPKEKHRIFKYLVFEDWKIREEEKQLKEIMEILDKQGGLNERDNYNFRSAGRQRKFRTLC